MTVGAVRHALIGMAAATLMLAGCAGQSGSGASTANQTTAASGAGASETPLGGDPGTWSPLHARAADDGGNFSMVPRQVLLVDGDFDLPAGATAVVASSDETVARTQQAEYDGDEMVAAPAVIAIAPGTATITVAAAAPGAGPEALASFTVTVEARQ